MSGEPQAQGKPTQSTQSSSEVHQQNQADDDLRTRVAPVLPRRKQTHELRFNAVAIAFHDRPNLIYWAIDRIKDRIAKQHYLKVGYRKAYIFTAAANLLEDEHERTKTIEEFLAQKAKDHFVWMLYDKDRTPGSLDYPFLPCPQSVLDELWRFIENLCGEHQLFHDYHTVESAYRTAVEYVKESERDWRASHPECTLPELYAAL